MMKLTGITLHLSIVVLIAALALTFSDNADAHALQTASCDRYWVNAKPGNKWQARFDCIQYVKAHNVAHMCARPVRPIIGRRATVKRRRADTHQRRVLTRSLNLARKMRAPRKHMVAIVAAITQESSARNIPYGHGTSVGILQLINTHGSVRWRMVIENSAGWFLRGARKVDYGQSAAALAQSVQRSAYPSAYGQWISESNRTVRLFLGPCQ